MLGAAVMCLALNVYFEARGEHYDGQLAVAEVTLNRVASPDFPDDVCDVVWQHKQFSWTHDGKSDVPKDKRAWRDAVAVARHALEQGNTLLSTDVLYYHADYVKPRFFARLERMGTIGRHIFYTHNKG